MLFADISGFTALSERLATRGRIGTEELVDTLSRVFGGMLWIAASHGGQLLKFGGDALLLLFTGPDHARHAASAAVEMRSDLRRATQVPTSVGKLKLSISMGAHSGAFHLFLVGDPYPQLVVLGPATTAAMDAESAAEAGQIVVTSVAAKLLGPNSTRPREDGELMVRWRRAAVDPFGSPPSRGTDSVIARRVMPPIMASMLDISSPDPMHRIATMAFFKFKGTDQRLENDGPEGVADALHDMLVVAEAAFAAEDIALLSVDVDANGGKLVCSSGVPLTSEDDEGRMLRAARAIVSAGTSLPLQVGIHRGHVFAGEMGSSEHGIFSVMGDTVNTAARIMVTASPGVIHVHPAVLDHARTLYDTTAEGPFTFKGKALPQVVYRVGEEIGPKESTDRQDFPFLGRDKELAAIRERVDAVLDGDGGVVTVLGAAGLGKSRLVREALSAVDHVPRMSMHAEPYGATSSYRVVRDPLRALFDVGHGDETAMSLELHRTVSRVAPHLEPFVPLVSDVLQLKAPSTPETDAIGPEFRAQRTADVVVELVNVVRDGPLLILLEDMHWADDSSAFLLGRIAESTRTLPWLLITARRDEPGGFTTDLGSVIDIDPLPDDAIRRLAVEATEAAPLRPHEIDLVSERAAGSPLFVRELITAAQQLGSLESVPASLQGTLAAQVDALDPLSKRVLSYASVLGRSFRRSIVDVLLRHEGLELDSATVAQLSRFIEADGPLRYRFKNGLVCDVVYDGLAYRMRARLHRLAGEAFEQLSTDLASDAAMLSLHFSRADDHERTYRFASLAAERAEGAYAFAEAAIHYERAVDAAKKLNADGDVRRELFIALGDVRHKTGMLDASLDAYRRAAALSRGPIDRATIHLRRATVRERAGALRLALADALRARTAASAIDAEESLVLQARSMAFTAIVREGQGRSQEARRAAEAAIQVAERCNDVKSLAQAYNMMLLTGLTLGDEDPHQFAQRALASYEQLHDWMGVAGVTNNLGILAYYDGRWQETLEYYRRALDSLRRIGNLADAAYVETNIGEVLINQGHLDEAESMLRDGVRTLRSSGFDHFVPFSEMLIGRWLLARGELGEAERVFRAVLADQLSMDQHVEARETSIHLAHCLARAGRPQDALRLIGSSTGPATEDLSIFDAAGAAVTAFALMELGSDDEAMDAIEWGVSIARARNFGYDLAKLLTLAARQNSSFAARLGTNDPAEEARVLLDGLDVVAFGFP